MGWLGSIFGGSADQDDPLRKLDPKLREFLEKESPVKFHPSSKPGQDQQPAEQARNAAATTTATAAGAKPAEKPALPSESLYQDGRYAHLWKTYRPLAEVEAEAKSDHEKLMDVLDGYKERRAMIGRTALENCALEQEDWNNCMRRGDWTARMTMCREQVRKFERCYTMQSRLLKALGYLSTQERSPELDEQIQLHADTLYHRMLEQEAAIEKAKAEGKPVPTFKPLISTAPTPAAAKTTTTEDEPDIDVQTRFKARLDKLPEEERAAEEEAMRAELRAKAEVASKVKTLWDEQAEGRRQRKEEGTQTVGDRISSIFWGGSGSGSGGSKSS